MLRVNVTVEPLFVFCEVGVFVGVRVVLPSRRKNENSEVKPVAVFVAVIVMISSTLTGMQTAGVAMNAPCKFVPAKVVVVIGARPRNVLPSPNPLGSAPGVGELLKNSTM